MSWQEELRRLDAMLAGGKISLHDHRRQREELLAAASGGFAPSPVASPLSPAERQPTWPSTHPEPEPANGHAETTAPAEQQKPAVPPQAAAPAAPVPPQAPAAPPAPAQTPPTPEPEQSRSASLLATDRPTSAPSPLDYRPTESMRHPTVHPTNHNTPTIITEPVSPNALPGLVPARSLDDGPNPPAEDDQPTGSKPTWLFLSLGVLIVLALIVGGVWWIGSRNTTVAKPPAVPPSPSSAAPATPPIDQRLPTLPGVADTNSSTVSVDKGVELGLYPPEAADVYKQSGVTDVVYRASSLGEERYFLLVIHAADDGKATAVADFMRSGALGSGFRPLSTDTAVAAGIQSDRTMNGTWYASGDQAVVLWVSQPTATTNTTQLKQHLDQVRAALGAVLPAN